MRYDYEQQQKNIEFMQHARDKLAEKVASDTTKARNLRVKLLNASKQFTALNVSMQEGARAAFHGTADREGLRQVSGRLVTEELESMRGYSCAPGTTPGPDAAH